MVQDIVDDGNGEHPAASVIRGRVRRILDDELAKQGKGPYVVHTGYPPNCEKCGKALGPFSILPVCRHCLCPDCMDPAKMINNTYTCPVCGQQRREN